MVRYADRVMAVSDRMLLMCWTGGGGAIWIGTCVLLRTASQ